MKPRENPNVLSSLDAVEALGKSRKDFQSCIGSALPSLTGSVGTFLEGGMYIADRRDIEALGDIHNRRAQRDRSQESHVKTSKRGRSIL
jgi:hypothetical protein